MTLSGIWQKYHMQYLKNLAKFHSLRGSSNRWITFFKARSRHFLPKYHNKLIMLLVTQKRRFTFHKCLWNYQVSLNSLVCAVKCFPDNGSSVVSPRESLIKATAKHTPTVCCPWDNRGLAIGGRGSGMHKSLFRQLLWFAHEILNNPPKQFSDFNYDAAFAVARSWV